MWYIYIYISIHIFIYFLWGQLAFSLVYMASIGFNTPLKWIKLVSNESFTNDSPRWGKNTWDFISIQWESKSFHKLSRNVGGNIPGSMNLGELPMVWCNNQAAVPVTHFHCVPTQAHQDLTAPMQVSMTKPLPPNNTENVHYWKCGFQQKKVARNVGLDPMEILNWTKQWVLQIEN